MNNKNDINEINLIERMQSSGCTGMLTSMNTGYIMESHLRNFRITGGMVICLCDNYNGRVSIDGKNHSLSGKCLAVMPENHLISFSGSVSEETMKVIAVTTDYVLDMPSPIDTSIFSYSRYIPVMSLSDSKYEDLQSYFSFLYKESHESSRYQDEIIRSILYALILEISGEYEAQFDLHNGGEIHSDNLIDRFFQLLAVYFKEYRTVRFYADKLCVTPKYLTTAVRRNTGRPVLDWIHEAVLIEAKMLLRTTDLTVMEIADRLNFSSSSSFVQFFKKHTGTTPKKL